MRRSNCCTSLVQHIKERDSYTVGYLSLYSYENQTILLYKTLEGNSKIMSHAQVGGGLSKK